MQRGLRSAENRSGLRTPNHQWNGHRRRHPGLARKRLRGKLVHVRPQHWPHRDSRGPADGKLRRHGDNKNGDVIWTALLEGSVRLRQPDGVTRDLAQGLTGINSIALTRDGKRLFVGLVFSGDGLYEIDLNGKLPPRQVVAELGGLNAFDFGPDGMIYGPSWNRGQVLRIDPESGQSTVIAKGLIHPGSVKFDRNDILYVLDGAPGAVFRVNGETGETVLIAQLAPATDNMVFDEHNRLLVSNMADNSVHEVNTATGEVRLLKTESLAFPRAIVVAPTKEGELIYVADCYSLRTVDPGTGAIKDLSRVVITELRPPTGISLSGEHVVLTCAYMGTVQVVERLTGKITLSLPGFNQACGAVRLKNGDIFVAEPGSGCLFRQRSEQRDKFVENLKTPTALCAGEEGPLYIAESGTGKILSIDSQTGKITPIASDLAAVSSLALTPDNCLLVLDVGGKVLVRINPQNGEKQIIARNLPVGYLTQPYPRSGGVAAGSNGDIYLIADMENALYKITPS